MNFFKKIFKRKSSDKKSKKEKKNSKENLAQETNTAETTTTTATVATTSESATTGNTTTETTTTNTNIRDNLNEIIKGIQENRILEVFDKYYHDDVVMFEKGDSTNRIGKAANRKAEESFVNNAKIHEARVLKTIVDGNNTAYEMYMDFNYGDARIKKTQWSFMEWKDGKVIKEEFNDSNTTPTSPATESTPAPVEHNIRANLEAIIKGIQENRILEVFDQYYHDDVVMFEKGDSTNRIGKAANRKAEESFVNNAKIHEARVLKVIVDGNNTAYEMYMDFNYGEARIQKSQWSFMEWKDGKVIKEEFNDSNTTPAPASASAPAASIEHNIRTNLEAIIKGIQENRILEVFDQYYHDDIVMFEKGDSTNRIGKAANRKAEESFVNNAKIHEARVLKTIVDGNNTAYEMYMDFNYGDARIKKTQWSFMEWKDGKVIKEEFNDSNTTPAASETESTPVPVEHNIRANLEAIIKGIQENRILEVFDQYYHDDIVMFEKGDSTNRIGKAANRKAEESFVNNAKIHEARVLKVIVDGNNTAYEMYMDFNYGDARIKKTQWSFMEWKDGKVIKEEFNDSNTTPAAPVEHDIRANLEAIIKGIQENRILEVFDQYYHDDIVMFEKGDSTNRIGKAANRKAEESFVNNAKIHEARVLKTIVDGNNTAYEMYMDFNYGEARIQKSQWSFMEWKDGKVIKEEFNDSNTTPAAPATESKETAPVEHNIRANLEAIIKGIQENRILEVFDQYYHDDVVMFEKGDSTNRIGKAANRKAEESFVNNAKIHEARVLKTIVDGNNTAYEMYMDFNYGDARIQKSQWSFMEWKDGKVIKEEFNDSNTTPAAPVTEESK